MDFLWTGVPAFFQWLRETTFYGHLSIMDFLVVVLFNVLVFHCFTPFVYIL